MTTNYYFVKEIDYVTEYGYRVTYTRDVHGNEFWEVFDTEGNLIFDRANDSVNIITICEMFTMRGCYDYKDGECDYIQAYNHFEEPSNFFYLANHQMNGRWIEVRRT